MDAWLILGLLGWMMSWVLVCAGRAMHFDLSAADVGLVWGILMLLPASAWVLRQVRSRRTYRAGDRVVYLVQKQAPPRAGTPDDGLAAVPGTTCSYVVRKLWTVVTGEADGRIEVATPGGKHHVLAVDDPRLRRAGILEMLTFRLRWHRQDQPSARA